MTVRESDGLFNRVATISTRPMTLALLGMALVTVSMLVGGWDALVRLLYIVLPIFAAALAFQAIPPRKSKRPRRKVPWQIPVMAVFLLNASLALAGRFGAPLLIFPFLFGLSFALILYTFLTNSGSRWAVPGGLALASMTLATFLLTLFNSFAFFYGQRDPLFHIGAIESLEATGHIDPGHFYQYSEFPAFHVSVATVSLVLGVSPYSANAILSILIYAPSPVFVYLFGAAISRRTSVSFVAALAVTGGATMLTIPILMIPLSLSLFYFLSLLVFLTRETGRVRLTLAVLPILGAWILTHQVSLLVAALVLACLVITGRFGPRATARRLPTVGILVIVLVCTLAYWTMIATIFQKSFSEILRTVIETLGTLPARSLASGGPIGVAFLIDHLNLSVLLFVLLLGVRSLASVTTPLEAAFTKAVTATLILLSPLYFPNALWLLPPFSLLELSRWQPLMELLLLPGILFGFSYLIPPGAEGRKAVVAALVVSFAVVLTAGSQSVLYSDSLPTAVVPGYTAERAYFDQAELASLSFVARQNLSVSGDLPTSLWLTFIAQHQSSSLGIAGNQLVSKDQLVLVRSKACVSGELVIGGTVQPSFGQGILVPAAVCTRFLTQLRSDSSVLYDSGDVQLFASYDSEF